MRQPSAEILVGLLVLLVAAGFLAFAVSRAGAGEGAGGGYRLSARFDQVGGISVGSDVRAAGVKIGAVRAISLDPETFDARLQLDLDPKVKIPEDSSARITSDSLLGGAYVAIIPGGSADTLPSGGEIEITQGSVDVFGLISSFAGSIAQSPSSKTNQPAQEAYP